MAVGAHPPGSRKLDTTALSALAHPLRVQLFDQLTHYGPATATQLAKRLGESSGATSYHLRQLERFGFVETDPDRGSGRERWWRRTAGSVVIHSPEPDTDPAGHAAARLIVDELRRGRAERHQHWFNTINEWPDEWCEASTASAVNLTLTASEMAKLSEELLGVLAAWKERAGDRSVADAPAGTASVEIQLAVFPLPAPDGDGPSDRNARRARHATDDS